MQFGFGFIVNLRNSAQTILKTVAKNIILLTCSERKQYLCLEKKLCLAVIALKNLKYTD
jgi:hypothetical protein